MSHGELALELVVADDEHTVRLVRRRERDKRDRWRVIGFYWLCSCGAAGQLERTDALASVGAFAHAEAGPR
jgi:hypothetical protein